VNIKVAAELGVKSMNEWRMNLLSAVKYCSRVFEKHCNIQFKINETEYWFLKSSSDSIWDEMNELITKVSPNGNDIVLGVVPQRTTGKTLCGLSSYTHGRILIRYLILKEEMRSILLHELSHIFGAIDLHEPASIMNINNPAFHFDEFTLEIIKLNRDRTFQHDSFPLPERHLDKAISLFKSRSELNLGESEVHRMLSILYFQKQDYMCAVDECNKALRLNPYRVEVYNILGNIYLKQGEIDKAIEEYQKALRYFSNLPELHFNIGLAYSRKGNFENAISEYQQAIKLNSHYCKAHAGLGCLYLRQGKIDPAIDEFQIALELIPEDADIICNSAGALILKYDSLNQDILKEKINRKRKKDKSLIESKAKELLDRAKKKCIKACEINAEIPEAHNILGIAYAYQDNIEKAEAEFLRALDLKSDFAYAHHNLSLLYFKNELWKKSAFHMKKIIDIYVSLGLGDQILSKMLGVEKRYYVALKPLE
jgi:tetratricopeptide (TPR) repeat protein